MVPGESLIYLDHAATTRCNEQVAQQISRVLTQEYGNPSSLHALGMRAENLIRASQREIARILHSAPEEITFTSGATEANNLALMGAAHARIRRGRRIVSTKMEHASVLGALDALEKEGFEPVYCTPSADGMIDPEEFAALVNEGTILVSCMLVNNETGALNPVAQLAAAVRRKNPQVLIHCDAVQAFGKLEVDVRRLGVDLLSLSGHKIHAPKGIGALYVKKGVRLQPLLYGGRQQNALRPGTENTAYISALGLASRMAAEKMPEHLKQVTALRDYFIKQAEELPGAFCNLPKEASPYIVNISFEGLRSETLLHYLESRGVYVSSGSACTKGAKSHVLEALGLSAERIDSALRFSFSAQNTREELESVLQILQEGIATLVHTSIRH